MPDLDDLDHFAQGLPPVNPLPPTEVRRRGDRLRRRNTALVAAGGVLAAAVAIGTPVVALSGGDGRSDIQPAPSPTRTEPPGGWTTTVVDGFPLTAGFADPDAVPSDGLAEDPNPTSSCPGAGFTDFTDSAVVAYQGEAEDRELRILAVYPDAAAAQAQLEQQRTAIERCGPFPLDGAERRYETVGVDLGTEESFGFAEQVHHEDGLVSDLTLFLLGRTGNAIYVDSSYGTAGGDDQVAREVARLTKNSAEPLGLLCVYSADPCLDPGASAPEGADASAGPTAATETLDIPDDFPLALGIGSGVDLEVTGPDRRIDGVSFADLCDSDAWPGTGPTDRLVVRVTGPEYGLVRELVTYEDAAQASAVIDALRAALRACPVAPASDGQAANDRLFTAPLQADTGYESSLTFAMTYREGLGGGIWQLVRVGRAVLATVTSGEYAPETVEAGVADLTRDNTAVTELMCTWTEAGC